MKNLFLISVFSLFMLGCSRENEHFQEDLQQRKTSLLKKVLNSKDAKNAYIKNDTSKVLKLVEDEFSRQQMAAPTYYGPYEVIVPVPAPSLTNQKIIYQGPTNYPPPGVYFADIYNFQIKVPLPNGAIAEVTSVETEGYSNYNNQTSTGFNQTTSTQNGSRFLIANTYTIALKYNSIGQYIGMVLPQSGGSKKFTYGYWIF